MSAGAQEPCASTRCLPAPGHVPQHLCQPGVSQSWALPVLQGCVRSPGHLQLPQSDMIWPAAPHGNYSPPWTAGWGGNTAPGTSLEVGLTSAQGHSSCRTAAPSFPITAELLEQHPDLPWPGTARTSVTRVHPASTQVTPQPKGQLRQHSPHTCAHTPHTHTRVHMCTYTHTCAHTHMHVYIHTHMCTHLHHIQSCTHTCTCTYPCTHTCTHTHAHILTCTRTQAGTALGCPMEAACSWYPVG